MDENRDLTKEELSKLEKAWNKKLQELQASQTRLQLNICKDCDPIKNPRCSLCLGS